MHLDNYMLFNNVEGVYTFSYPCEKKEDCLVCSKVVKEVSRDRDATLQGLLEYLRDEHSLQNPIITTTTTEGESRTLYMAAIAQLKDNSEKKLTELNLVDCQEIVVTDSSLKSPVVFRLKFND